MGNRPAVAPGDPGQLGVGQRASRLAVSREHRCLLLLQSAGFAPRKQFPIQSGGRLVTIADFAFPDQRVAIYIDGASIHLPPQQTVAKIQSLLG